MRGFLKFWLFPVLCVVVASTLSYFAFYSYWFAPVFHSVSVVRACNAAGSIVLLPVRLMFFCYGGLLDQSTPYNDPWNYILINAVLLGLIFYISLRPWVFRDKKPAK